MVKTHQMKRDKKTIPGHVEEQYIKNFQDLEKPAMLRVSVPWGRTRRAMCPELGK